MHPAWPLMLFIQLVAFSLIEGQQQLPAKVKREGLNDSAKQIHAKHSPPVDTNFIGLEPRISDRNFIKDIVDRLHALDADIGKLLFNSTSMYAADDHSAAFQDNTPKGGERFTEVLADLDSLQDEVSLLRQ